MIDNKKENTSDELFLRCFDTLLSDWHVHVIDASGSSYAWKESDFVQIFKQKLLLSDCVAV